ASVSLRTVSAPPSDAAIESLGFRSLQRMAEISADRVGFLVCPSSELAFRAIMKTASGVGAPHLRFDYGAFSDQLRKLRKLGGGSGNAHATHPLFTVRCRALSLFEMSESFHGITRSTRRWAISTADMDEKIATDLAESTGYHPIAEMENSVRRALIWLMLRLFIEDGRFSKPEQAFLRENFDAETAESAIAFVRDHGPVAVVKKYGEALDSLAEMNDAARSSVCAVIRRVASVASGAEAQRLSLLGEMHRKLRCDRSPGIEPWDDENDLGSLIDIR
ncbi:MAG: hypothetical protein ACE5F1_19145, partial [Planctomycetota bacterium]